MSPFPDVSVVIPTLNRPKRLLRAIKSLDDQEYEGNIKCIIIDSSADDSSKNLIENSEFKSKNFNSESILNKSYNYSKNPSIGKNLYEDLCKDLYENLRNKTTQDILNAQKSATETVFKKKNIPFRSFKIIKRNEEALGELFCFFILENLLLSKLLKVNPINQHRE